MVSVTGLLASTSATSSDENRDPLATADNASAEATPIPTPANMDLFITLLLVLIPVEGLGSFLAFCAAGSRQGHGIATGLTAQKVTAQNSVGDWRQGEEAEGPKTFELIPGICPLDTPFIRFQPASWPRIGAQCPWWNREPPFCVPVRKDPMTEQNMYDAGLGKTPANFEALTP